MSGDSDWFEDYIDDADSDFEVIEYDIHLHPMTSMSQRSSISLSPVPSSFQAFRGTFVWDIRRSSKLIESLLLGLPVPQLFLYEQAKNKFLVIDGQQRLMSIYYFIKQRYPRKERRAELRLIFDEHHKIPDDVLHDDHYFTNFRLQLPTRLPSSRTCSRLNLTRLLAMPNFSLIYVQFEM